MKSIRLGSQEWMSENLNVCHFRNGDPIQEFWETNGEIGKAAWTYYNNDPVNASQYGRLYNWHAITDSRGLAPIGWHIPDDSEWQALITLLGGAKEAGIKLKIPHFAHWQKDENVADEAGFNAVPAGMHLSDGEHGDIGVRAYFWTVTEASATEAWYWFLGIKSNEIKRFAAKKSYGFSIRCIRD